jgi:hypothetical protein
MSSPQLDHPVSASDTAALALVKARALFDCFYDLLDHEKTVPIGRRWLGCGGVRPPDPAHSTVLPGCVYCWPENRTFWFMYEDNGTIVKPGSSNGLDGVADEMVRYARREKHASLNARPEITPYWDDDGTTYLFVCIRGIEDTPSHAYITNALHHIVSRHRCCFWYTPAM